MPGELRIDPHVKVLDDRVVRRAKSRGLDALVYAPHFTRLPDIRQRAARFTDGDLLVLPGREVFAGDWRHRTHVLALGLTDPVPDFITLEGAMAEFADQGATVLVPHPGFMTVSLGAEEVRRYRASIHGVEVYNPKHLPSHNRDAKALAADLDLPAFGSSYAHLRGSVGEVWTTFVGVDPTADAICEAFASGTARSVERRTGRRHRFRCAAEFTHLFYENSWGKLNRVVLSDTEATHPRHPAYNGRFDDVAVY